MPGRTVKTKSINQFKLRFENFKNYLVKEENKKCTFQPAIRKNSLPNYEKVELDINSLKFLEVLRKSYECKRNHKNSHEILRTPTGIIGKLKRS